ncbi:hypothetical protein ASG29_05470 [Sphingomonas sp. Leaf412]|uniref:chemotaxis protein CheW n=1 Tax=Sphingomonas sp. Leaf412 TaxID=1736370 RepID=UPI0006F82C5C|nr:chemotaxis protein CheW [Sphingomonas sp. Leaf412]KQT33494.1 hypothetical protein ASG29_05470 [Sphingomonas sp. Leaf412]
MNGTLNLVAHLGGCGLLIEATRVDSVVDVDTLVPVPGVSPAVLGLAAMRSRVATVIDARRLLGLPAAAAATATGRAVVTAVDGHLYAIAVDTLEDVARFEIEPVPPGMSAVSQVVCGVAEGEGETLLALDIDRLIAAVDGHVNVKLTPADPCRGGQNNG